MVVDKEKALLFGAAAALRLLLFEAFPSLPDILSHRVEISTPVSSITRLREGLFLYTHNVSPYEGGVYHQAPLLLPLFSLLPHESSNPVATYILFIIIDLLSAHALYQIADSCVSTKSRHYRSPRWHVRWSPVAVAAVFLFSPFTIATCLARSPELFTNCAILLAIAQACAGNSTNFILALSLAAYLSLHPVLLFPPLVLLCYDSKLRKSTEDPPDPVSFAVFHIADLFTTIGVFLYISYLVSGSWDYLASTYGERLLARDLKPNVGLWWYFFIEIFDSFRDFFIGVFWLHMVSYVGGLTIRFRAPLLLATTTLIGILSLFTPYPSVATTNLYLSLLPLFVHLYALMRYPFLSAATLAYAAFLGPAFYYLWIYAGSGNANFFYAITLVWSLGLSIVVVDLLWAGGREAWEVERGFTDVSKVVNVRQI